MLLLFVIIILIGLLCVSLYANDIYIRRICRCLFIFISIYIAGFRDMIGQDYPQYVERLKYIEELSLFNEPSFTLLAILVKETDFSHVFFFLIMSIITLIPIYKFYYSSKFPLYSIFIFLLFPGCGYLQTFNLVRQFAAIAISLYAFKYVINRDLMKFLLITFVAFLFHFSAIFLIPLYYIVNLKVRNWILVLSIIASLLISKLDISLTSIVLLIPGYESYYYNQISNESSTVVLILNAFMIYIILNKKLFVKDQADNVFLNYTVIGIVLYNLSIISEVFMRLSLYGLIYIPITLTLPFIKQTNGTIVYKVTIIIFFILVFINLYLSGYAEDFAILPFSSLFD